jgi:hypothetical protein
VARDNTRSGPERTEDDIQREQLGPQGVRGALGRAKLTPQREKKASTNVDRRSGAIGLERQRSALTVMIGKPRHAPTQRQCRRSY